MKYYTFYFVLFCIVGPWCLVASPSQPICLTMVVCNESVVISRCLSSVRSLIDYWVILDAGSTDNTKELIREFLKDIPGELHEYSSSESKDIGNEALALSRDKGAYILCMGACDYLEFQDVVSLPVLVDDVYCMWWKTKEGMYLRRQLLKASLPWTWERGLGEYLCCQVPCSSCVLEGVRYVVGAPVYKDAKKYEAYIAVLLQELIKDPHNVKKLLYLAESYRALGQQEKALKAYEEVACRAIDPQEIFWSLFQVANLRQELGAPIDHVIESYYKAYRFRPHRIEAVYCLAHLYNRENQYELAYETIKSYDFISKPAEKDSLGSISWMEKYGLLSELAVCSFYVGKYQESKDVCDALLLQSRVPDEIRQKVLIFKKMSCQRMSI